MSANLLDPAVPIFEGGIFYPHPESMAFCENLIDSSSWNQGGVFARMFAAPGDTYLFKAHPEDDPAVLPACTE